MTTRTAPTSVLALLRLVVGLALGLVTVAGLLVPVAGASTGASAGATASLGCDGRRATVVGSRGRVAGTPGDDVIVVLGGRRVQVEAGAGDDRICVRGHGAWKRVVGGPGDDRVLVERSARVFADLRAGTDTFRGGPRADMVLSGSPQARNADRVLMGGGADTLVLVAGRDHRRALLRGGSGPDLLRVARRAGALLVDAGEGRATLDGRAHARWSGFDSYDVSSGGRQSFVGTSGDDEVSFDGRGPVEAATSDGDDTVTLRYDPGPALTVPGGSPRRSSWSRLVVDAGAGQDLLVVGTSARVVVGDLTVGRIDFAEDDVEVVGSLSVVGVEDVAVNAPVEVSSDHPSRVELVGDASANALSGSACHVVLRGGDGDDRLHVGSLPRDGVFLTAGGLDRGCRRSSEVHGEAGDDTMTSRVTAFDFRGLDEVGDTAEEIELPVTDLLDGGDGVDTADAGAGRDTCVAETRVACEA